MGEHHLLHEPLDIRLEERGDNSSRTDLRRV